MTVASSKASLELAVRRHGEPRGTPLPQPRLGVGAHLGFGRIVVSQIEAPNMLVNLI